MILGLLAIPAFAGFRQKIAVLGPTSTDNQASTFDITIAAGAAGVRNCLTQLDLTSVGAGTFRVLDGGTTIYAVAIPANGALVREWSTEEALCGTAATAMNIKMSTSSAGAYTINHVGYTY